MEDLWDETAASALAEAHPSGLGECIYASRLLGAQSGLVLCGGGNSSVKSPGTDLSGAPIEVLHVKGSGWDLAGIEADGFAPLRRDRLLALLELDELSDAQMMHELRCACLVPGAPDPSVETLLHALLPYRVVLHTHADAVLALTDTPDGERLVAELYGKRAASVPYLMPGFDLARYCATRPPSQLGAHSEGVILIRHGIFTFGETGREAYRRMIALVSDAEDYLAAHGGGSGPDQVAADADSASVPATVPEPEPVPLHDLIALRQEISNAAGRPMILTSRRGPLAGALLRGDLDPAALQRGPATPDHVIRTKRVPMIGRDVEAYAEAYRRYFDQHSSDEHSNKPLRPLDPAPRVVVDPELGLLGAGPTAKDADSAVEIYEHTLRIIAQAEALGGYRPALEADIFAVEYWELEQAKLARAGRPAEFRGEVALVTGAASGIGRACVRALRSRGAAVVGVDKAEGSDAADGQDFLGIRADLTDADAAQDAVRRAVDRFGGLDMLVAAAGIFGPSAPVAAGDPADWRTVMAVNLDSLPRLFAAAHPALARAPRGARVVLIGSKNVPAPGPGAAAYSASKAAATQLARVAALEWAADGIRVNTVHPDAVFDTGLWSAELIEERARRYGLTAEQYRRRNLLSRDIDSDTVARAVAALCSADFDATTGAQVPVDGGNERVV
jgi:rhamnose utilization protein RhaD (predicted bifunctional aldolase and dehydrogenase)/NAD(P)-dependent dehydrogenase (short-subunit alcohol dehydrogenase family)